ncbi:hypothetical protein SDC9_87832 [bioreactor metagenome]|uniref:peptidylprolyl isomerase n=1 Tax=bioreactor metagenome TaxID=1076179 RepID=A0A644ZJY3_9ZZZZ
MAGKKTFSQKKLEQQKKERTQLWITLSVLALAAIIIVTIIVSNSIKATDVEPTAAEPTSAVPTAGGPMPTLVGTKTYSSEPPFLIDVTKTYLATVKMAKGGEFVIRLYPDKAPITVNSFVFLARQGYFDGTTFHRVLKDFMAQGGDPTGTGAGGPGYQFVNENSDLKFDKAGVVAMANAGQDTNGSQFFITFSDQSYLNGGYTIFGQVISGMDVVNSITLRDPQTNPTFEGDAIESITIEEK